MEPTDKDRLDWLDRNDFLAIGAFGYCTLSEGEFSDSHHVGTIREAIDSAMAAERSSGDRGVVGEGVG